MSNYHLDSIAPRERCYILGSSPSSIVLYRSAGERETLLIGKLTRETEETLSAQGIRCRSVTTYEDAAGDIIREIIRNETDCLVFVNTEDDRVNRQIGEYFLNALTEDTETRREPLRAHLLVYLFGENEEADAYDEMLTAGGGCIRYISPPQRAAMDFVGRYPFARFFTEKQIDVTTSLMHADAEVQVCMLGFTAQNRQLLRTSVAVNQLVMQGEGDPALKPIQYHIFDRHVSAGQPSMFRYMRELGMMSAEEYLPLAEIPAKEFYVTWRDDTDIVACVREIATRGERDITFVIISCGCEEENITVATRIASESRTWKNTPLHIFVRAEVATAQQLLTAYDNVHVFGEQSALYDVNNLTEDPLLRMAQMRNEIYDIEYALSADPDLEIDREYLTEVRAEAEKGWYQKSAIERDSSLCGCLSIRSKLNLMGLDCCPLTAAGEALTEEEYLAVYAAGDPPARSEEPISALEKRITLYTLSFPCSRRRWMAVHEHHRWNAFMFTRDFIPAARSEILSETIERNGKKRYTNGKNYAARRHGNLTTFDGLITFRQLVAVRDGKDELSCDVIKYDYQLMDDVYWLLMANGFKIIRAS